MKKHSILCAMALILIMALAPAAYAAAPSSACYPVSTTRNEDGTEIRKVYDLSPEEDPAGIARSDFEQEGFHYTLVNLLRQESPEYEERIHTETVSIPSKNKDMESVLALLPTQREFVTEDGLSGTLNTGRPLTPNLAPGYQPTAGAVLNGSSTNVQPPDMRGGAVSSPVGNGSLYVPGSSTVTVTTPTSNGFTEVTEDLYYSGGYLAKLKIPSLNLNVKVYEGTGSKTLEKGAGHFEDTSIWDGNVGIAGHNRGTNCYFGSIHTLKLGDQITLTTKLGTRTYEVTSVSKVSETDRSGLAASTENKLTLYTCVQNQSAYRWCVTAHEIG